MNAPLLTQKMAFRLIALFALIGGTVAVIPAPRFQAEAASWQTPLQKELLGELAVKSKL